MNPLETVTKAVGYIDVNPACTIIPDRLINLVRHPVIPVEGCLARRVGGTTSLEEPVLHMALMKKCHRQMTRVNCPGGAHLEMITHRGGLAVLNVRKSTPITCIILMTFEK